jgi:hypothetical protein
MPKRKVKTSRKSKKAKVNGSENMIQIGNPPHMVSRSYLKRIGNTLRKNSIKPHVYIDNFNQPPINYSVYRNRENGMTAEIREMPVRKTNDEIYDRLNQRFGHKFKTLVHGTDFVSFVQYRYNSNMNQTIEETLSNIISFLQTKYPNFRYCGSDREILEQYIRATEEELNQPKSKTHSGCSMMGGNRKFKI